MPKLIHPSAIANNAAASSADRTAAAFAEQQNANADDGIDGGNNGPTINGMSNNLTARILGFLSYRDIMRSRICCRKFRDAARNTIVPWVDDSRPYSIMRESGEHKYCDGEEPNEEMAANTSNYTTHDIQIISSFRKLRSLVFSSVPLNGRYPSLFNFPLLQTLTITSCYNLRFDLEMLSGLPSLKELRCSCSRNAMTGNIKSLRVIKDTLENVDFWRCGNIEGDFMDLADFPRLKALKMSNCSAVTGDIREIGESDFPKLKTLELGSGVIGVKYHEFQRISDVPSAVEATLRLKQRDPPLIHHLGFGGCYWNLSRDSPDWYDSNGEGGYPPPPFSIDFVRVGSRIGWRWRAENIYNRGSNSCEINWLDPEPDRESNCYDVYIRELQSIQEDIFCFEGYHQPPTEEEYKRLCEEYYGI